MPDMIKMTCYTCKGVGKAFDALPAMRHPHAGQPCKTCDGRLVVDKEVVTVEGWCGLVRRALGLDVAFAVDFLPEEKIATKVVANGGVGHRLQRRVDEINAELCKRYHPSTA